MHGHQNWSVGLEKTRNLTQYWLIMRVSDIFSSKTNEGYIQIIF
jgi:hypothetical protein